MRHSRAVQLIPDALDSLDPIDAAALRRNTVDDLRSWEQLGGQCRKCRRQGDVDQKRMRKDFGLRPLNELQTYLRCVRCDNRIDNRFVISKMARD